MRECPVPMTVAPPSQGQSQTSEETRGQERQFPHIILTDDR